MNRAMRPLFRQILKEHKVVPLVAASFLFWVPAVIFLKIAGEILEKEPIRFDEACLEWLHMHATPLFDSVFLFFTSFGEVISVLAAVIIVGSYLVYRKQYANLFLILFGVGGAAVSNVALKLLFQRDRPALWDQLITETSYSFPSGHAMISSALILSFIVMAWRTRWRLPVAILGIFFIGMIGVSRLYLGVHYPTDIVAGWAASAAWITVVMGVLGMLRFEKSKRQAAKNRDE